MKKVIEFHKLYTVTAIVSIAVIASGIAGYFLNNGFNFGVDFKAGSNERVQLVKPAAELTYSGAGNVTLSVSSSAITLVYSGADVAAATIRLAYAEYPTLSGILDAIRAQAPGVNATIVADGGLSSSYLVPSYVKDFQLSERPSRLYRKRLEADGKVSIEDVRKALDGFGRNVIQAIGEADAQQYLVRVEADETDPDFAGKVSNALVARLEQTFGANSVVTISSDSVGARASSDMAKTSVWVVLVTLLLILVYAVIRFKLQYGIGAILAVVHDMLVMIAFIVWTRQEFNVMTIAAILTILGYSINDTIVIFDRVRENRGLMPNESIERIVNISNTEMLGRTFITTTTTMLTALSLFIFTTGDIKAFALALIVGMISGTYSTIFISNSFVVWWDKTRAKLVAAKEKRDQAAERKLSDQKKARRDKKAADAAKA
jgi:preprotein translocase subunit SecF